MTKYEFLRIIEEGLEDFPPTSLEEILYDYEEHFTNARNDGKLDSEIIEELGDPYTIVNQYRNGYIQEPINKNENTYTNNPNSQNTYTNNYENNKHESTNNSANRILKIIILILIIFLAGPTLFGLFIGIASLLLAFMSIPYIATFAGITAFIGKLGFNILGFRVPEVNILTDLPTSVIILVTIGSIAGIILSIITTIYIIKGIILGIRKIIDLFTNKGGI